MVRTHVRKNAGTSPANFGEYIMEQLALTIPEACAAVRLGRTTLYAAIKSGDLVATKCGRKTIIRLDDLRAWLKHLPKIKAADSKHAGFHAQSEAR